MPLSVVPKAPPSIWSQPQMQPLSLGAGDLSAVLRDRLRELYTPPPSSVALKSAVALNPVSDDKELRLFNVAAALKIAVSQVSMHLAAEWRRLLFEKIDELHQPDDWEDSDSLVDMESFKTFLRTILQQGPMHRMSLGLSGDGHILAGWRQDKDSFTLKFLSNDEIHWSVVRHRDGSVESAAGRASLSRLSEVLQPYSPESWFGNANKISAP
jgi:hypothetical protein